MLNENIYKNTYPPYSKELGDLGQSVAARRLSDKGWRLRSVKNAGKETSSLVDYVATRTSGSKIETRLIEVKAIKVFKYAHNNFDTLKLPFKRCDAYDDFYKKAKSPLDLVWVDFRNKRIFIQDFKTLTTPTKVRGTKFPFILESENWDEPKQMVFAVEQFDELGTVTDEEFRLFDEIRIKYDLDRSDVVVESGKVESGQVKSDKDDDLLPKAQEELLNALNIFQSTDFEKIADADEITEGKGLYYDVLGSNEELRAENKNLKAENTALTEGISRISNENKKFREEIERLKNERDHYRRNCERAATIIAEKLQ